MIYTVTFNPSIDYMVELESLQVDELNRTLSERMNPGGKGINVSLVLRNLGMDSVAMGFVAGFTGEEIEKLLIERKIKTDFIHVGEGCSRINVKAKSLSTFGETEINGQGPVISDRDYEEFLKKLENLGSDDTLILSGAGPKGRADSIYAEICQLANERKVKVVIDASGKLLTNALVSKPFLIKPNLKELEGIFGSFEDVDDEKRDRLIEKVKDCAYKLQDMGAMNVLVSLGGEGAVLVTDNHQVYEMEAPKGDAVNTIGAGDSMVAGFIAGLSQYHDYEKAFVMSVMAGSASAFSKEMCTLDEVKCLMSAFIDNLK